MRYTISRGSAHSSLSLDVGVAATPIPHSNPISLYTTLSALGLALDLEDYHSSVILHCWLGHLTCKIVSEMTYTSVEWDVKPNDTIPLCNGQCQLLQSISG